VGPGGLLAAAGSGRAGAAWGGAWSGWLGVRAGMLRIVATRILMIAGRGIAQRITGGRIITIYYEPYAFLGSGYLLGLPFALVLALLVALLPHAAPPRTALGLFWRAHGPDPLAA